MSVIALFVHHAEDIFKQLRSEEFDQAGGVLPVGVPSVTPKHAINAQLFTM